MAILVASVVTAGVAGGCAVSSREGSDAEAPVPAVVEQAGEVSSRDGDPVDGDPVDGGRSEGTTPTDAPTTTTTAAPTTTTIPPTTTTTQPPPPSVRQGAEGPEVAAIQTRLFELGYRPADVAGHYGAQTASAVMAFQKREGLPRDGVVGLDTLARMAEPQGAPGARSGPGPWIEVDIGRQIAFVADPTGAITVLNVSTGNGERYRSGGGTAIAHTPRGEWPVYRTVNGMDSGPLGTLYRPLYFTGGYAVHGSPSVPAHPASHGCVRVSNADADWLWDFVGQGVPVQVRD